MEVERVQCIDCERMILPETAARNQGLCAQCAKVPESYRQEKREFDARIASGEAFRHSPSDLAEARDPAFIFSEVPQWREWIEPTRCVDSARPWKELLSEAAREEGGHCFLSNGEHREIVLAYNQDLAVCEYRSSKGELNYLAYLPSHVSAQLEAPRQLEQICSCCGVGMTWYPSRFHLSREAGFAIFAWLLAPQDPAPAGLRWLLISDSDIGFTSAGKG